MATYKSGIKTKENVYKAAKKLFYQKGYRETSLADIAEAASVHLSLVTYYYKKEELLIQTHEDYFYSIIEGINTHFSSRIENTLQWLLLFSQLVYIPIYNDSNNLRVFNAYQQNRKSIDSFKTLIDNIVLVWIDEFELDVTRSEFEYYIDVQYGGRRELINKRLENGKAITRELLYFSSTIALRLAQLDPAVIQYNIQKADQLLKEIDKSEFSLLL